MRQCCGERGARHIRLRTSSMCPTRRWTCSADPQELLRAIAAKLKLDVKLLSLPCRRHPSEEKVYTKLRVVEGYLRSHVKIGAPERSAPYFGGGMSMR